jgi:PAS domain S-box-containing protein
LDPRERLLESITRAHTRFVLEHDPRPAFDGLLVDLLDLSGSEYGLIAELLHDVEGPYLETRAITNIAWNDAMRRLYDENAAGGLEFRNLDSLLGAVVRSGAPVIANEPARDPRRAGLPAGHPALRAFLGLPLHSGDRLVGIVGVANRPGGYGAELARGLEPFLSTCANLIEARRSRDERDAAETALRRHLQANDVVLAISSRFLELTPERVDAAVVEALGAVARFLGAERASFSVGVEGGGAIVRTHVFGREIPAAAGTRLAPRYPSGLVPWLVRALARGEPLLIPSLRAAAEASREEFAPLRDQGARSVAYLPARAGGTVVGAVTLMWFGGEARIDASSLVPFVLVADLIAASLRRKRTEEALERRVEIEALVLEMSNHFLGLPVERVDAEIEAALGRLAALTGADRVVLDRLSEDRRRLVRTHAWGRALPPLPELFGPDASEIPLTVLESVWGPGHAGRATLIQAEQLPVGSPIRAAIDASGVRSAAALPAREAGEIAGAVLLLWTDAPTGVKPADLEALCLVADLLIAVKRRQQAELALRESEERFRAMADSAPLMVWTCDQRGRITFVNQACERFAGKPRGEFSGVHWVEVTHPEERVRLARAFVDAFAARSALEIECRIERGDGEWRHVLVSGAPRFGPEGALVGYVGSSLDITDRKRLEEELRHAQKMEAVGRLAGGIAHDFNNILTAMIGHVECARLDVDGNASVASDLDEIDAAARRAAQLTRQLLAFARRQRIEPRLVDPNQLVSGVEQMLRRLIGEHIQLEVDLGAALPAVRVDPGQLEQVLINLAVNARDAMPGGGRLRIETSPAPPSAAEPLPPHPRSPLGWVRIRVADTGVGMDEETLAHVFEPFFTTKEAGRGTGLGLATCYGIVRQSEGHIHLESRVGAGTTVEILLPAAAGEAQPAAGTVTRVEPPSGREAVLLVEDEESVRRLAARVLRARGYHVIEAENAVAARAGLARAERKPDLVVTDMVMPGEGGPEVARWMRQQCPGIPILFVSGYSEALAPEGLSGDDGYFFLGKPFTPHDLVQRVREILDGTPTRS